MAAVNFNVGTTMKSLLRLTPVTFALAVVFCSALAAADQAAKTGANTATNFPPRIKAFCADKEQQVRQLAGKLNVQVPLEVADFFKAAKKGDWAGVAGLFSEARESLNSLPESETFVATASAALLEVELAREQFEEGEPKYALAFGTDIIKSIPKGSVYFGGTDPGRGLVTALCASHEKADPFFTLTQNALADGRYLTYLRSMYGARIETPSKEDSSTAFQDYLSDAQRRLEHDTKYPDAPRQIRPGEDVRMVNKKVQVSGQVAVMSINGLLAKMIFDRNPSREFFVEESSPLDWMYPHLSPHGLIMKINRQPPATLSEEIVGKDRKFWLEQQRSLIGGWLEANTSVQEISRFAEKVFIRQELSDFAGDPKFVNSEPSCQMYSKLRSSIGGIYAWRAKNTKDPAERQRMEREADFAFRQAFAFCPYNAGVVFRYAELLTAQKRFDDVILLAETAAKLDRAGHDFGKLIDEVRRLKEG